MAEEQDGPSVTTKPRRSVWRKLTPYMLIAPTIIYLAAFFAYPMFEGLKLAVWDDEALLPLIAEPSIIADQTGTLPQGAAVEILGRQGNVLEGEATSDLLTEEWFFVSAADPSGTAVTGWAPESRIRVREENPDGSPSVGTVRTKLGADADPLTDLFAEANQSSEVVAQLEARTEVQIAETATLEVWFEVRGATNGDAVQGWAPSRFIQVFADDMNGRVDRGSQGELTARFIERMVDDRFFGTAVRTTLLLMAIILPVQFVVAMIMALVIHARIKFSSIFLYIFSVPLGMSDLAVGILFFSIFTGNGFLNSILEGLGIIDGPQQFLTADTRNWIIVAIVLAEVWRATSIVMVIIVSGLQAIPDETLEAAELFGASYWQRVRHIMLPLLKPSLQVALILRTILAFQVFAVVIALGGGTVVTVLANETYRQYFTLRNNNVASVYALFILLLSLASAFFYLRAVRTQQEVEAT